MKQLLFICLVLISSVTAFAQFPDTATLNQYIRDTIKDRRPDKITVGQLQKAFLGITGLLQQGSGGGGEGGGSLKPDTLTRAAAYNRAMDSTLVPGQLYYIRNVDSALYNGTNILIRAFTKGSFEPDGIGYFYNPDYINSGYPIWKGDVMELYGTSYDTSLLPGEWFTAPGGKQGRWMTSTLAFRSETVTPWDESEVTVTGITSGRTATFTPGGFATYAENDKVIWGGRIWNNKTGNAGYTTSQFELNGADWEPLSYSDPAYVLVIDAIKYDWVNNVITGRREEAGNNEVFASYDWIQTNSQNPVKYFQWGRPFNSSSYTGMGSQRIINGINDNINFRGSYQINIEITNSRQYDLFFDESSSQYNIKLEENSEQYDLFFVQSSQSYVNMSGGKQRNSSFNTASQYDLNFTRATQLNLQLNYLNQSDINLWGVTWNRDGSLIELHETHVYKFAPSAVQNCPDQVFVRIQDTDVSTPIESTDPAFASSLDFDVEEDDSYIFEYELYVHTLVADALLLNLSTPELAQVNSFFTFHNISSNIVSGYINVGGDSATLTLPNVDEEYHIRITGVIIGVAGGTIRLGLATETSQPAAITLKAGSFARFTKFKPDLIPDGM